MKIFATIEKIYTVSYFLSEDKENEIKITGFWGRKAAKNKAKELVKREEVSHANVFNTKTKELLEFF